VKLMLVSIERNVGRGEVSGVDGRVLSPCST
jgi:hypothetical protein